MKELLAINLIKVRKIKNWTQEDLAQESGLSRQTINRFENQQVLPDLESFAKICTALNVSPKTLFLDNEGNFNYFYK